MSETEPKVHFIEVEKSLRYYFLGNTEQQEIDELVFVFHGYGQLAYYFSQKFKDISNTNVLFVFPEGMHRFYLNGTSGRVGASWMTKEMREHDIIENNRALNRLLAHLGKQFTWKTFSVLGFSQGGATASRWLNSSNIDCQTYISWASVFPPDISMENFNETILNRKFVIGNEDPFFNSENFEKAIEFYRKFNFEIVTYTGGHAIEPSVLNTLFK